MRNRVELDLKQLLAEMHTKREYCDRTYVGSQLGNQYAFIELQLQPHWGFSKGRKINVSIKITLEYPYKPPIVYNHDETFCHPNKDQQDSRFMFSFVDKQYWKPVFEIAQVICGLEMVLITPDLSYTNMRTMSQFSQDAITWIHKMSQIHSATTGKQSGMVQEVSKPKSIEEESHTRTPELELQNLVKLTVKGDMDIEYQSDSGRFPLEPPHNVTYPQFGYKYEPDPPRPLSAWSGLLTDQLCRDSERMWSVSHPDTQPRYINANSGVPSDSLLPLDRTLRRMLPAQKIS